MKTRVTISQRPIKDGVFSLFLDYRLAGTRRRDNLKLYIYPERTSLDRIKNAETMRVANAARERKEFELEQMENGVKVKSSPTMVLFSDLCKEYEKRYTRANTLTSFRMATSRIGSSVYVQEMDSKFFKKFIDGLEDKLAPNTIRKTVSTIMQVVREAHLDGIVTQMPRVNKILPAAEQSIRTFLSMDELRMLDRTPCKNDVVKNAFMFSCFTGLRFSDVETFNARNVIGNVIVIRQTKTREPVRIPLTSNALRYLPEGWEKCKDDPIFKLGFESSVNRIIKLWAKAAKIEKNVSYHVSRHTFATLSLNNGADMFAVQKLMGHSSVATTQIYAKMLDDKLKKEIGLIPNL